MEKITTLLEKQLESPTLGEVLANCKTEGIKEEQVAGVLDEFLRKVRAEKFSNEYWERVRLESMAEMPKLGAKEMKNQFLSIYAEKYEGFVLDPYSEPLINLLCMYFTDNPKFEESGHNYSLNKGIMIHGDVGTGKSSIMSIFCKNQKQSFRIIPSLDVAIEFSKDGYKSISKYPAGAVNRSPREYWNQEYFSWCFDDLGVDTEKKHFGNEANVMEELIQMIYDSRKLMGKVHFTTNLNADQIKKVYGSRVASRLREMVNIIEFPQGSPDRRK